MVRIRDYGGNASDPPNSSEEGTRLLGQSKAVKPAETYELLRSHAVVSEVGSQPRQAGSAAEELLAVLQQKIRGNQSHQLRSIAMLVPRRHQPSQCLCCFPVLQQHPQRLVQRALQTLEDVLGLLQSGKGPLRLNMSTFECIRLGQSFPGI